MRSRRRSGTMILALVGVLMGASAASAQALFRSDDVGIYDSTGKRVGPLTNYSEVVLRTRSGHSVFLQVVPERLFGNANLHFPERGCSGRPFLNRPWASGRSSSWVGGPRQTLYVQAGEFGPQRMRSTLTPDGECRNSVVGGPYAPAERLDVDLADYFTPPFALRAIPEEPVPIGPVAERPDRSDRIVLYDATGKKVGAKIRGSLTTNVVLVTASGITFELGGVGPPRREVYFESTDCSGPRFMQHGGPAASIFVPTFLVGPRSSVYRQAEAAEWRTMYSSMTEPSGECRILDQSDPVGYTAWWARYAPIGIDLADYFTPPATFRAGPGLRSLPGVR
jgi:hypothetical protein